MIQRIIDKITNEYRKDSLSKTEFQPEMTLKKSLRGWYDPVIAGPETFIKDCTSVPTIKSVIDVLEKLTADSYIQFNIEFLKKGMKTFGDKWRHADINTVLYGIASNISVSSYLEVGVRRGRSMAMIASLHPNASLYGFDMWIANYGEAENPGPDLVRKEIQKVKHVGEVCLTHGDSHKTLPRFRRNHPGNFFDIITVDGDHTRRGALRDLKDVIPMLKVGGFLVFDDICNPGHLYLEKVWNKHILNSSRFKGYSFTDSGYGVSFAIKQF